MNRRIAGVIWVGLIFGGCAGVGSLKPGGGLILEVEDRTYEQVWKAAVAAVGNHLAIVESDKKAGIIKSEMGMLGGMLPMFGEVVGVFIQPAKSGSNRFKVEVISKKKYKLDWLAKNWGPRIREEIKLELGL